MVLSEAAVGSSGYILVWPLVLREIGQHQLGLHFSTIRIMFRGIIRLRAVVPVVSAINYHDNNANGFF
jgi:hypothetical protein